MWQRGMHGAIVTLLTVLALTAAGATMVPAPQQPTLEASPAALVPEPTITPPAPEPRRVLLVGDSIMWDAAPAIEAAISSAGHAVFDRAVLGFGLSRVAYYDWRTEWPSLLGEHQPTDVVVMTGPWDLGARETPSGTVQPSDAAWIDVVSREVDTAVKLLGSSQARVWWLTAPPLAPAEWREPISSLNQAIALGVGTGGGRVVDTYGALADAEGRYQSAGRKDDGIHLCPAAAEAVANAIVAAMGVPAKGWEHTAWRSSTRFTGSLEGATCTG